MKDFLIKFLGKKYTWLAIHYRQMQTYVYSVLHPYHYDAERYAGSFLEIPCELTYSDVINKPVDRVIYIFWTGDNEITPNRLAGIHSMETKCGVPIKLITPKNLLDYIKPDDPLPESYQYLSLNHRSDYLRAYFMYHYGGGYADIKTHYHSWVPAFERLDSSKEAFAIGYPEVGFWGAAQSAVTNQHLKRDVYVHWRHLIGNTSYIFRPNSVFTAEWYSAAKKVLVDNTEELRAHPAKDIFGTNPDYPLPWLAVHGSIFHPLCLKYKDKLLKDKALMPSFENYR